MKDCKVSHLYQFDFTSGSMIPVGVGTSYFPTQSAQAGPKDRTSRTGVPLQVSVFPTGSGGAALRIRTSDRYKIKLENRSYREGASREGKALDELRKNRALKQEYVV
jgi:hypothetical protein